MIELVAEVVGAAGGGGVCDSAEVVVAMPRETEVEMNLRDNFEGMKSDGSGGQHKEGCEDPIEDFSILDTWRVCSFDGDDADAKKALNSKELRQLESDKGCPTDKGKPYINHHETPLNPVPSKYNAVKNITKNKARGEDGKKSKLHLYCSGHDPKSGKWVWSTLKSYHIARPGMSHGYGGGTI